MSKNNDRGVSFEQLIEQRMQGIFPERKFDVKISKGSGNQRHDGDVQVLAKTGYQRLVYTDCKNFESQAVPSLAQIGKAQDQADILGFKAAVVIMKNKNKDVVVSMNWDSFQFLLEALAKKEPETDAGKLTLGNLLNGI